LSAAWLWAERAALAVLPGDEGIYLYGGLLVSRGAVPYRDFFLAHPPLRVALPALAALAGLPLAAFKAFVLALAPLAAGLLGLAVLPLAGPAAACLAMLFHLAASPTVETSGAFLGPEVVAPLLAGSLLAATRGRFAAAGALAGVAGLHALYALMPLPVLAAWAWREGRLRPFLAGLALLPAGLLATWAWAGDAFPGQILGYHLAKVAGADRPRSWGRAAAFLRDEAGLLAFAAAAALDRRHVARAALAAGAACVAVVVAWSDAVAYHFAVGVPFLAAAGALGLAAMARRARSRSPRAGDAALVAIAAAVIVTHVPHVLDAAGFDGRLSARVRDADAVTAAVEARPPRSGRLWGDGSLVPLVALRAGLDVAANAPDTNGKRFSSGVASLDAALDAALAEAAGVLLVQGHGLGMEPRVTGRVGRDLSPAFRLDLPALGTIGYWLSPRDLAEGRIPP
jgi:hypothetical protein